MDIVQELLQLFEKQLAENIGADRAIVFWYDAQSEDRDLEEIERALNERGIKVWKLNDHNAFQTKVLLELEDTENSYLIYAPFAKPKDEDNFLLDILLYSGKYGEFQADEIAIMMKELRIDHLAIRPFIEEHWAFFKNKQRVAKFKKLLPNNPNANDVKQTMMAVLCDAKSIHPQELLKSVVAKKGGISDDNEALMQMSKYLDVNLFFELIEDYFGVSPREEHRLSHIIETIVYQHVASNIDEGVLQVHYPCSVPNICKVFIDDWLKSDKREELETILLELEQKWNVPQLIETHTYQAFIRCFTFPIIERKVLDALHELLLNETVLVNEWKSILAERRKGYWYQTHFAQEYELSEKILDFYEWKIIFERDEAPKNEQEWFSLYAEKYYRIDQLYRHIYLLYRKGTNLERYEQLIERVTFWYENKYLMTLAAHTDHMLETRLSKQWNIPSVMQQKNFYQHFIRPLLEATRERIFVIISDALRYEIGMELLEEFQQRLNTEVKIIPMQATLPTYTQLGMAALLPGKITGIKEDGTIYVNDLSTKGLQNRNNILQMYEVDSIALKMEDFIQLTKDEGQEYIRGKRVVYLYHDAIDAIGDSGKTEAYTYEAVENALERIKAAVRKLTGTYEAVRIFLTSDHGFLYQTSQVEQFQKAESLKGEIYDGNRRFAIGKNLTVPAGAIKVSLDYLGVDCEAVIAKGLNRFTAGGGLRFVHGGAMPQESIIPLIEYRQIKGKARKTEAERVNVQVALIQKVITSYRFIVPFFQEEKVSPERQPRTLRAAFYRNNERISNEVTITFDSTGEVSERQIEVVFHLLEDRYRMGEICVLRLEDVSGRATELYAEEEFELKLYSIE